MLHGCCPPFVRMRRDPARVTPSLLGYGHCPRNGARTHTLISRVCVSHLSGGWLGITNVVKKWDTDMNKVTAATLADNDAATAAAAAATATASSVHPFLP